MEPPGRLPAHALSDEVRGLLQRLVAQLVDEVARLALCRQDLLGKEGVLGLLLEEVAATILQSRQPPPQQREPQQRLQSTPTEDSQDGGQQ